MQNGYNDENHHDNRNGQKGFHFRIDVGEEQKQRKIHGFDSVSRILYFADIKCSTASHRIIWHHTDAMNSSWFAFAAQ